ncbi:MAG TPA: hypothetical protein VFU59_05460 [Candidatus Eisenbacteria bacterium]|nr:hypothetical protein [Candidatus Eisenbacteria bacterium]
METKMGMRATIALLLMLSMPAIARAQSGGGEPMMLPEGTPVPRQEGLPADSYVAEVVDSTFFVGPAEFFALDLPTVGNGVQGTHLTGTVTASGGKRDIIVRLFSGTEYDRWLKKRGGKEAKPFWISPKARVIALDHDLPAGEGVVMLLDNGYSIRTPKRVHCQIQIQYRRLDGAAVPRAARTTPANGAGAGAGSAGDDVVPTPRSNDEEDQPPPPPPPPSDGGS